jgi:hypothetical protein
MAADTPAGPGATPGTPTEPGVTPSSTGPAAPDPARDAPSSTGDAGRDRRDADAPTDEAGWRKALNAERERRRIAEREARDAATRLQDRERSGMSELERLTAERDDVTTERDELRNRLTTIERETLARTVATEAGVPDWWDKLTGDGERALREDAARIRERLGLGSGSLDAGPRQIGGPPQPRSMDDLIRRKAGAARG